MNKIRQILMPLSAAMIWGTAFVAQSLGANHMEPFGFNALRFFIGFLFLFFMCMLLRSYRRRKGLSVQPVNRELLLGGFLCGLALAVATALQQKGLETTSSGKAGFITALYIVIVPIISLVMGKKAPKALLFSVPLAVVGLYCLCITEDFRISSGDFYIFLCALCFSAHIMIIDHYTQKVSGVEMSCIQFLTASLLSSLGIFFTDFPTLTAVQECLLPLLYLGIFSSGVAYTLQILAQKGSNPTVVSLLLSLESVFAVLAGALLLHDQMSGKEYFGCVLMLTAVVLAQLPKKE